MNTEFRTKLRVKRWKANAMSQAAIEALKQQIVGQQLGACPRCGVDRNGCRPSPCPHGNLCGIKPEPSFAEQRIQGPIFVPQFSIVGHASRQAKADVWN